MWAWQSVSTKSCPHWRAFQGAASDSSEESDAIGGFVFVYGKDVLEAVVDNASVYGKG